VEEPEGIKQALARQARNPVRWVEIVRALAAAGVTDVVECGPGKVLSALTRRIEPTLASHAITDAPSLAQTLEATR
jgi:[acyl-carrier-protein] S-malonyltransferase